MQRNSSDTSSIKTQCYSINVGTWHSPKSTLNPELTAVKHFKHRQGAQCEIECEAANEVEGHFLPLPGS